MKWKLLGTTALIAFSGNSGSNAADLTVKAPAAPIPFSWSGYYVGALAGYSWRDPSIDITGNGPATATYLSTGIVPGSITVDPKGFLGGVQAGINYQNGGAIFGFETDLSYANIHDGGTVASPISEIFLCGKGCARFFQYNSTAAQKLDWFGTVRGSVGITPYERVLIFATGGLAYGHANLTTSVLNVSGTQVGFNNVPVPLPGCTQICATGSTSEWLVGWTLGAGAKFALSNSWVANFEYLYYDLGSLSVSFSDPRFSAFVFNSTAQFRGNIVRAGLSFKFN